MKTIFYLYVVGNRIKDSFGLEMYFWKHVIWCLEVWNDVYILE